MATKHDVIRLNREHPDWCSTEIARELGCGSAYVRATATRNGLLLQNKQGPQGPRKWTTEKVVEFDDAYRDRSSPVAEIGARFGLSKCSAYNFAHRHRLSRFGSSATEQGRG